jgi:hypothetical protein
MGVGHDNKISITVYLAASPVARASFTTVLYLVPQAANSLNTDRVREYASTDDVDSDLAAGYISATTAAALTDAFSQPHTPELIKVGRVDLVGGETWATGLDACIAADPDFYGIVMQDRDDADVVTLGEAVEADGYRLFIAQSASAWTSGLPVALTNIDGNERTAVLYHDTSAEHGDLCWAVNRLFFDPDEKSAPWECRVEAVEALATGLTTTQRNAISTASANVGLAFGSADFYVAPGQNMAERKIYEIVTADWLKKRLEEDLTALKIELTDRGDKITVDTRGQALVLAQIRKRLLQGESVGHFLPGETSAVGEDITDADRDANRLRFTIRATIAGDATTLTLSIYTSRDLLSAAA